MSTNIGPNCPRWRFLSLALLCVPLLAWQAGGAGSGWVASASAGDAPSTEQEADQEAPPRLPAGVAVVFLPLQSAGRAPAGGWPGAEEGGEVVLDRFDDEVGFALRERRSTRAWVTPGRVADVARRNPMMDVDARALAFQGIRNQEDDPLYEPLHGQLRSLTALLDARLVVLPFGLRYERAPSGDEAASDRPEADPEASTGRPVLEVAIVDTRAGRLLWVGNVEGTPADPGASGMLTELADRLVRWLAPS